jgi:hypothetical protein
VKKDSKFCFSSQRDRDGGGDPTSTVQIECRSLLCTSLLRALVSVLRVGMIEVYFQDNSCVLFEDDISTAVAYKMLRKHPKAGDGLLQDSDGTLVVEEEGRSLEKLYEGPLFFIPSKSAEASSAGNGEGMPDQQLQSSLASLKCMMARYLARLEVAETDLTYLISSVSLMPSYHHLLSLHRNPLPFRLRVRSLPYNACSVRQDCSQRCLPSYVLHSCNSSPACLFLQGYEDLEHDLIWVAGAASSVILTEIRDELREIRSCIRTPAAADVPNPSGRWPPVQVPISKLDAHGVVEKLFFCTIS